MSDELKYLKGQQGVGSNERFPDTLVCRYCDCRMKFEMAWAAEANIPFAMGRGYSVVIAKCRCEERTRVVSFADIGLNQGFDCIYNGRIPRTGPELHPRAAPASPEPPADP